MLKKLISPLQSILLQKKMCPACTVPLEKAKPVRRISENQHIVVCQCKRVFIHEKKLDTYRRALEEEL